jgi:hypothetical protein
MAQTFQPHHWDCIAVTIRTPPAHDVAGSPLATNPTSASGTTLAIDAPVARLISWGPTPLTTVPNVVSIATSICPIEPHPAVSTHSG